jgi:hypothetical protein
MCGAADSGSSSMAVRNDFSAARELEAAQGRVHAALPWIDLHRLLQRGNRSFGPVKPGQGAPQQEMTLHVLGFGVQDSPRTSFGLLESSGE